MEEQKHRPPAFGSLARIFRPEHTHRELGQAEILHKSDLQRLRCARDRRELANLRVPWQLVYPGLVREVRVVVCCVLRVELWYDFGMQGVDDVGHSWLYVLGGIESDYSANACGIDFINTHILIPTYRRTDGPPEMERRSKSNTDKKSLKLACIQCMTLNIVKLTDTMTHCAQTRTPVDLLSLPSKKTLCDEFVGRPLADLRTPALVVDRAAFAKNCARMLETAQGWGARFRAHLKTHKVGRSN